MGGLSKKAFQIDRYGSEFINKNIRLDAGALLFKNDRLSPGLQKQAIITAEAIVDSYNAMHFDAVGIAPHDLAAGLSFLRRVRNRSAFAWLSANLVDKTEKQPVFEASVIRKVNGLTIGIIGLTGNASALAFTPEDNVEIAPWETTLPNVVANLSKECGLIILLSSLSQDKNIEIAKRFTNIHMIIQAGQSPSNIPPQIENNSLLLQTGKQGKYLGLLQFSWLPSRTWGTDRSDELNKKRALLERYTRQIDSFLFRGEPDETLKNDPRRQATYNDLIRKRKAIATETAAIENEIQMQKQKGIVPSTFHNTFIAIEASMPDNNNVLSIVEEAKKLINNQGKAVAEQIQKQDGALTAENFPYTGWNVCADCHKGQAKYWKDEKHFQAYKTLQGERMQFNLDCLPCHVTTQQNDNDSVLALPVELLQVGCESCHGPGKRHASDPEKWPLQTPPPEETCKHCHTPERDEAFNYTSDLKKLGCSKAATEK